MKKYVIVVLFVFGIITIGGFLGCETTDGTNGLTVSPSEKELTKGERSVTFTVGGSGADTNGNAIAEGNTRELSAPYTWSVSKPTLGHITAIAGNTAVYESRGGHGVNVITVKDQYDAEGVATVTQ